LAPREDEDISTAIQEILDHEGVKVRLNATCIGFSRRGDEIVAHVDCASGDPEVSGSHVLVAVSRRPNTGDLGLTEAGVTVDKRGYIVVDVTHVVPFLVEDELKRIGGLYEKAADWAPFAVVDGRVVTGQNPASSTAAARALMEVLAAKPVGRSPYRPRTGTAS